MLSILLTVPSCFNSFWHGVIPTSYFIFNDFYTCSTHFFSHKYSQDDRVGSLASAVPLSVRYSACAIGRARALERGSKWRLRHPETPVELSVSLFANFGECIGSSSIGYRVDWCKNHRLQSNQFVCRPDEEEEEKKKMEKIEV